MKDPAEKDQILTFKRMHSTTLFGIALSISIFQSAIGQELKPMTLDDLMGLSSVLDARISPQGNQVAYVVSKPSLAKNRHEASLFVVPITGGAPRRLAEAARIFGTNL